jgi:hypothetical protein
MNPSTLVDSKLVSYCENKKSIVIVGFTKTGKVTIAKELSNRLNIPLLISDHYISGNYDDALQRLMNDVLYYYNNNIQFIVEGILCFRLLRKGIKLNNFYPDLVIRTECNDKTIEHFYHKDNESSKIKRAFAFNKGLESIWTEYLNLLGSNNIPNRPNFIKLNTSIF